jgi:protein O-GlcNAc transferase
MKNQQHPLRKILFLNRFLFLFPPLPTLTPYQALEFATQQHRARRFAEAETVYRQLLTHDPNNAEVLHLLGVLASDTGRFPEALDWMQRSIAVQPRVGRYYRNLGLLLAAQGRLDESATALETARQLEPGTADFHYDLGNTRWRQRQWEAAIEAFHTALQLQPRHFKAWLNLSATLSACQRHEEALTTARAALVQCPNEPALLFGLGNILKEMGRLDEALAAYQSALSLAPGDPFVLNNLANLHKDRGEITEALAALRQSLAALPVAEAHSNLIFTSRFDPTIPPETIQEQEQKWNTLYAVPLRSQRPQHSNNRSPDRRLRIGYVSADLRNHAVGRTLLPIFEAHDRAVVECVCYAGPPTDPVAARFQARADLWRNMDAWPDAQLAAQIQTDGIDILVDLSLHTAFHRLSTFARKPAPVQVSWLGYPGSSGVESIDYYLTDRFLHPATDEAAKPPGRPIYLPDAWCCYPAPEDSPEVGALPAAQAGRVTFVSFNNFAKINGRVLALWARILHAVPDSRLLLLARTGGHQERARTALQACDISPQRLEFLEYQPAAPERSAAAYLHRYAQADIALDPFPYNGMTTSGDALWMGVPVVALRGATALSRASFSILSNLGLPELAASREDEYVQIATSLAGDTARLAQVRATLRTRMQASPLLDPVRFARNLEAAYREMWRQWCGSSPGTSNNPAGISNTQHPTSNIQ